MSNAFWSSWAEKMKKFMTAVGGAEGKLFCVVCKVQLPADPSVHADDNYVVERVKDSIARLGYACIVLRDFYKLEMMHDVNWNEMHRVIFRHKKKNSYALLYSGDDLRCVAENAMKSHFETKISELVDINYHSFSGSTKVKILTIKGTKTNGQHLSCDFVDVHHAESILSHYKMSHGAGGSTARVEPHSD